MWHYKRRNPNWCYYGLGETSGALNKHGRRFVLDATDAMGYNAETSDPLYKHWPFYIVYDPELQYAHGLFYDTSSRATFDFGCEIDAFWGYYDKIELSSGGFDYYVIGGASIDDVVRTFVTMIGRPCLLPRYALNYLGSTMT
jgi:alpha-glucosidase